MHLIALHTIGHGFCRGFFTPHFHCVALPHCVAEFHGGGGHGGGALPMLLLGALIVFLAAIVATAKNKKD